MTIRRTLSFSQQAQKKPAKTGYPRIAGLLYALPASLTATKAVIHIALLAHLLDFLLLQQAGDAQAKLRGAQFALRLQFGKSTAPHLRQSLIHVHTAGLDDSFFW